MGCSDSRIDQTSPQNQPIPHIPYNRDAPLTLSIEDICLQRYTVQATLGTSVKDLYVQVGKLRGECSLYYAGEWLPELSAESLGDFGMAGEVKLDLLDKAQESTEVG